MVYDIAIIGGGPAGLSAGIYARRAGKSVVLFEGKKLGGLLNDIRRIENYPGFLGNGEELATKMCEQLLAPNCTIVKKFVLNVVKIGKKFLITAGSDTFEAKKVIYCGGYNRKSFDFLQKFEGKGVSYCATCDGAFFKDRTVALVGDGYDAIEEVRYLESICKEVHFVSSTTIEVDSEKVIHHLPYEIVGANGEEKIEEIEIKNRENKEEKTIKVDGLFVAMGGSANNVLVDLKADGFIKTNETETQIFGLFVAGDIQENSIKQVVVACADGAKAAIKAIKQLNEEM